MSPYLAGGMLIAFIAWSGFMYYEGGSKESAVCGQADAKQDLAQTAATVTAEQGVIATIGKQQTITEGVDHDYQAKERDIANQYVAGIGSVPGQAAATGYHLPTAGGATGRPDAAASRPFRTKVFKLSAQECDENTAQLYGLQKWENGQQAIKPQDAQ